MDKSWKQSESEYDCEEKGAYSRQLVIVLGQPLQGETRQVLLGMADVKPNSAVM